MISACNHLKSASFILTTTERNKKGIIENGELFVKLERIPLKMYVHMYVPRMGVEVLYRKGDWNDHLFISPHAFPYVNMKLEPNNLLVRENSHHTVCEIGFDYLTKMIGHYQERMGEKIFEYLTFSDTVEFDRHRCVKMEFDYPHFSYFHYKVKKGEDVVSIAADYFVHEYMIVCANKSVDDIHDVKEGQEILVPNMFARKIIFYVDLKTMLPLMQEIHDDKGFFEKYEYRSFVLNPAFEPAEFTPGYKDYGF